MATKKQKDSKIGHGYIYGHYRCRHINIFRLTIKSKNNYPQKDSCPFCQDADKAIKNLTDSNKKKNKKSSFWKINAPLLAIALSLIILIIAKSATVAKTKEQPLSADQSTETVAESPTEGIQIDSLAPDFTSEDINGNQISLSDFRGQKPVLLVFWATWCGYCAQELPNLKTFTQKHQDDIQVIAISSGEVKNTIVNYVKEKDINFMMLLDEQKKIWNSYLIRGTPSHFLIDQQGKIFTLMPGLASLDNLETMLKMLSQ